MAENYRHQEHPTKHSHVVNKVVPRETWIVVSPESDRARLVNPPSALGQVARPPTGPTPRKAGTGNIPHGASPPALLVPGNPNYNTRLDSRQNAGHIVKDEGSIRSGSAAEKASIRFRTFFGTSRDRDREKEKEKEGEWKGTRLDVENDRSQWEISRLIGYSTSTNVEDWSVVMDICDKINMNDSEAKEASKALRKDIELGRPAVQLSAGKLWAVLMRNCWQYFVPHTANRKFLGKIEEVILNPITSPVVRDRLVEVIGTSVYMLRDFKQFKPYQATWKKLRLQLRLPHPNEGLEIPAGDPMLNPTPPQPPSFSRHVQYNEITYPEVVSDVVAATQGLTGSEIKAASTMERKYTRDAEQEPRWGRSHHHFDDPYSLTGPEEDMRHLFEECEISRNNCRILAASLDYATPEILASNNVIKEFRVKCMKSQEIIGAQIDWATAAADRARAEQYALKGPNEVVPTVEEQLLHALLTARGELNDVFKTYDDLERIATSERNLQPNEPAHPEKSDGLDGASIQVQNGMLPQLNQTHQLGGNNSAAMFDNRDPLQPQPTLDLQLFDGSHASSIDTPSTIAIFGIDQGTTINEALPGNQIAPTISSPPTSPQDNLISRTMVAREVVSRLVAHGCQDISAELDLTSFGEYPVSHGGFSDIYQGKLLDGRRVAVKALRVSAESIEKNPKHLKHAARELYTWSRCRHPNVMPLLGLAIFRNRIGMIAPWMEHGSLPRYLEKAPGANRFDMCVQICEGLAYLHQIRIIHCDLKGANVLVSDGGTPVLTDFGTSLVSDRTLGFTQTSGGPGLTARWAAAEILEASSHTEASDVYALGMEIMAGKVPYHDKSETAVLLLVTIKKEPPQRPECMSQNVENDDILWKLLVRCWSYEPAARPSATEVTAAMRSLALTWSPPS